MPTTDIVELFIGGGEGAGWLPLGTWESDHWESPAAAPPPSASGTAMSIANLDGVARGRAGGNIEACLDGRLGPDIDATVSPPEPPGFGYGHIALATPDWPLAPRPVAVTATGPARYQTIGEEIFAGRPVDPTDGAVEQVVVGDLDGDGDDEAIVTFEFIQPAITGAAGDFAALFVVDTDTGSAQTVYETHVPAPLPAGTLPFTERFRVIAVADLNGDGRMEVAVHSWYYEGASVELFEYDGATLIPALGEGCGS